MFFYNMVRFLLIVATTGIGCWLIWLCNDRPALRRTAAAISLIILLFNKPIALGIYGVLIWVLEILLVIYLAALLIAIPIVVIWAVITK